MKFFDSSTVVDIQADRVAVVKDINRDRVDEANHQNMVLLAVTNSALNVFEKATEKYPELLEAKDLYGRYALQLAYDDLFDVIIDKKPKNLQDQIDACINEKHRVVSRLIRRQLFSNSAVKTLFKNPKKVYEAEIREYYPGLIKEKLKGEDLLIKAILANDLETFRRVVQDVEVSEVTLQRLLHRERENMILVLAEHHPRVTLNIFGMPMDPDENKMLQSLSQDFYDQLATYYTQQTDKQYHKMMDYIFNNVEYTTPKHELLEKILGGIASVYQSDRLLEYLDAIVDAQKRKIENENRRTRDLGGSYMSKFEMDEDLALAYVIILNQDANEGSSGFDVKLKKFREEGKISRDLAKDLLELWSHQKRNFLLMRRFNPKERRPDGSFYPRTD
jgi:hypothetical protein